MKLFSLKRLDRSCFFATGLPTFSKLVLLVSGLRMNGRGLSVVSVVSVESLGNRMKLFSLKRQDRSCFFATGIIHNIHRIHNIQNVCIKNAAPEKKIMGVSKYLKFALLNMPGPFIKYPVEKREGAAVASAAENRTFPQGRFPAFVTSVSLSGLRSQAGRLCLYITYTSYRLYRIGV
jgi:hypothetical protein